MASFDLAYKKYIQPNEGGYSNIPQDKGGETYAGIARNYHPSWEGFSYIDFIKRTKGEIDRNTKFPDIQYAVDQFYLNWWNTARFGEIKNQDVANLLFDFNVNSSSTAIKTIQRLVGATADGVMGPATVAAINNYKDQAKLHDALKEERRKLYEYLIQKDPTQSVFADGWAARLARFPTLAVASASLWILLGGAALALAIFHFYGTHKSVS
jgi:lysozyme family protein